LLSGTFIASDLVFPLSPVLLCPRYMAEEWGFEVHDDRKLFEMLILEGAQAGLSWKTILMKRDAYRAAFHNFDISKVAAMTEKEQAKLLEEGSGIVRNRLKVKSTVANAKAALKIQEEEGSLDKVTPRRGGRCMCVAGQSSASDACLPLVSHSLCRTTVSVVVHPGEQAAAELPEGNCRGDGGGARDERGAQEERHELRRAHHHVRLHAGPPSLSPLPPSRRSLVLLLFLSFQKR
jgi:3-methyladenine DNA glycosylase Tag